MSGFFCRLMQVLCHPDQCVIVILSERNLIPFNHPGFCPPERRMPPRNLSFYPQPLPRGPSATAGFGDPSLASLRNDKGLARPGKRFSPSVRGLKPAAIEQRPLRGWDKKLSPRSVVRPVRGRDYGYTFSRTFYSVRDLCTARTETPGSPNPTSPQPNNFSACTPAEAGEPPQPPQPPQPHNPTTTTTRFPFWFL
jgi:hypothetical protein